MTASSPPLVGVACCRRQFGSTPGHVVFEPYLAALVGVGLVPMLIPAIGGDLAVSNWSSAMLERLDGLLLPGSPSNVEPARYAGAHDPAIEIDPARDATTLPLIREAVALEIPILAVCRGYQELNVALGGTLSTDVEARTDAVVHRARQDLPRAARYEQAHDLTLRPGGRLAARLDDASTRVNSLHRQGVAELAPPLRPEAWAPDGLVEAASHIDDEKFVLGVQWHPEWNRSSAGLDAMIFDDFARACRQRAARGREARSA